MLGSNVGLDTIDFHCMVKTFFKIRIKFHNDMSKLYLFFYFG